MEQANRCKSTSTATMSLQYLVVFFTHSCHVFVLHAVCLYPGVGMQHVVFGQGLVAKGFACPARFIFPMN